MSHTYHNSTPPRSGELFLPSGDATICAETFGLPSDPSILLICGAAGSMDEWDDELCLRLAAGGRHVIRYDNRDTGRSTSYPAGEPGYGGAELVADAVAVLDQLGVDVAHVMGISMGASPPSTSVFVTPTVSALSR